MIKIITNCRICGENQLTSLMLLENQALTGVFPKTKTEKVTSGAVELVKCTSSNGCGLVQLRQSYDLSEMYGLNYGYRSGLNASMVKHLHSKVANVLEMNILQKNDLIIDIGSNDATTLRAYPQGEYDLVGIDPTGLKFSEYYPKEIRLIPEFFSADAVTKALGDKKAKVITSFSMFYDLEDPVAFAKEIEGALADDGVWIFEQSYLPAMLRTNSFDTICHEHLEFYAVKQILWIAEKAGLKVLDVEFNDVNGGSFSITCAKVDSKYEPNHEKLNKILADETKLGLDTTEAFDAFKVRVEQARNDLMNFLKKAKSEGKRVCGLGASTKGNVLLQYYGITEDLISEIGEVNSDKFGSFTPGTLIPLTPEAEVLAFNPDYLLVLPWHFRAFFESLGSMKGRKLVFPLPDFQVVHL
ncbi:class I SAM-dependent methyltransferase [Polynucleobacter sp. AM-25C3]|uniref:class I SAM-dependent methyltransferase n=1 Tax=Polynucleobacter sp. AM-25C3 TaxID=1855569 RepID=UPI001C0C5FC8|nr:class I SAM-dependent methyltransferase [Polynucleobacter sp. AM-25C3]MBU3601768.1 methyltransferase domain-containing protein [Polynucleobacter sp. AM-25C3]